MSISLSKFVAIAKILLGLSIIESVTWLEEGSFTKQFYFKLDSIIKVIAGDRDNLEANLKRRGIVMIVNLKKDISQIYWISLTLYNLILIK